MTLHDHIWTFLHLCHETMINTKRSENWKVNRTVRGTTKKKKSQIEIAKAKKLILNLRCLLCLTLFSICFILKICMLFKKKNEKMWKNIPFWILAQENNHLNENSFSYQFSFRLHLLSDLSGLFSFFFFHSLISTGNFFSISFCKLRIEFCKFTDLVLLSTFN